MHMAPYRDINTCSTPVSYGPHANPPLNILTTFNTAYRMIRALLMASNRKHGDICSEQKPKSKRGLGEGK